MAIITITELKKKARCMYNSLLEGDEPALTVGWFRCG